MPRPIKIDAPALRLDPERAFESLDWGEVFESDGPVEIELGIGVGRFLLAAAALASQLPREELAVVVVGCPAEENGVGKQRLVEAGVFADVDAALMAHASDMRRAHRLFLGNRKIDFTFHSIFKL